MPTARARSAQLTPSYWLKHRAVQNFGDSLSELLWTSLGVPLWWGGARLHSRHDMRIVHMLGSVISDPQIQRDLEHVRPGVERPIVFWGCGMRNTAPLLPELAAHCRFLGVRGPLTRDQLGCPAGTTLGDPALLLPLLHNASVAGDGPAYCMPHLLEPKSDEDLLGLTGAAAILRVGVDGDPASLIRVIDAIRGASFVLAGALHAAIVAAAYGIPFAFFDGGFVDVPFKWRDFAASAGFEARFASSIDEGMTLFNAHIAPCLALPPLAPILACAPFNPPSRLQRRAEAYDRLAGPLRFDRPRG